MLSILGIGFAHPETEVTNDFILSLGIDTTKEWITEKIGVNSRRSVLPLDYIHRTKNQDPCQALEAANVTVTDLGTKAACMAMERAGIKPEQIGLVICNACFSEQVVPNSAQKIAAALGTRGKAYDVLSACPAFAFHVDFLRNYEEERLPEYVLCLSAAAMTLKVDYSDRTDPAIWGDGAAAWIVSAKHLGRLKIVDSFYTTDPSRCGAVTVDRYGFFRQDGRAVRDFSVRQTVRLIKDIENRFNIDWTKDIFVGHQANVTMLQQVTNNRKIPDSNHWYNAPSYGNQGGAGAPIVIAQHWNDISPGQRIVVAVLGAGLSWGSIVMEGCPA